MDGPAGSGKSTLAAMTAEALGLPFLDSGTMFRAMACRLGQPALRMTPRELLAGLKEISFSLEGSGRNSTLLLNGRPTGQGLRTEEAGRLTSALAMLPEIREFQKKAQRMMAGEKGLVAEGRDMGTVVFPWADYKFFITASARERARRRVEQLAQLGMTADLEETARQIEERDRRDSERPIAPLKAAPEALLIDTTELNLEMALAAILNSIKFPS